MVGSLVVSSLIVLPTAIAMQYKKGYRFTQIFGICVALAAMLGGLTISYYLDWPPGATIVVLTLIIMALVFLVRGIIYLSSQRKKQKH